MEFKIKNRRETGKMEAFLVMVFILDSTVYVYICYTIVFGRHVLFLIKAVILCAKTGFQLLMGL